MPDNNPTKTTPQFGTAEYAGGTGSERCQTCKKTLGSSYYRVNGSLACAYCGEQAKLRQPTDSHQAFVRGLLFGIGGAILGLIGYAAFGIITGLMIGYISLAVGWLIGKAMMKGSNGIGGRRYQITAVLLTYAAVSMAAIPIAIASQRSERSAKPAGQSSQQQSPAADNQVAQPDAQKAAPQTKPKMSMGAALLMLAGIGLASPFLELAENPGFGLIGLVILFVGIRIAWRLTQGGVRADIQGPY